MAELAEPEKLSKCKIAEAESRPCWQTILLGFATGSAGGVIGVGGGIVVIPVLTMWGVTQRLAQGTSLIVIAAISPVAILTYYLLGNIDFKFAIPLAIGGVIGSRIGSLIAQRLSNNMLSRAFGFFLILISLKMLFMKMGEAPDGHDETIMFYLESGGMGLLAGLFAGFFGVGGGVVFVPTGVLLGGLPQHIAQGSSFTAILPTTIMGAIVYWKNGEISRKLLKWLIPGALVGAAAGSYIAALIPSNWLRIIFAIYLLYTGAGSFLPATRRKKTD